jgi:replicative DNA helicase
VSDDIIVSTEAALLGELLFEPDAIAKVIDHVSEEDFGSRQHELIFSAIKQCFDNGVPPDLLTVSDVLKRNGTLAQAGGASGLSELMEPVFTSTTAPQHARIVREAAQGRRLRIATSAAEKQLKNGADVRQVAARLEKEIFTLSTQQAVGACADIKEIVGMGREILEQAFKTKKVITGVATGYPDLDTVTMGFQPTDLVILAARPSRGKTALGLNFAVNTAVPVAVFSLEMSKEQLALRMICAEAQVDNKKARAGYLSKHEYTLVREACIALERDKHIFIDDSAGVSISSLRAKAQRLHREHGIGLLVIDYLQLMSASGAQSREQEISMIARSLKGLAKELKIPVIALSQLNRKVEERTDKRPQMSDLRESGAIEQDADVILFLYRDEVYHPDTDNPSVAELIIAKNRNGPLDNIRLVFQRHTQRFLPYVEGQPIVSNQYDGYMGDDEEELLI